jgi:hypothetical protein
MRTALDTRGEWRPLDYVLRLASEVCVPPGITACEWLVGVLAPLWLTF